MSMYKSAILGINNIQIWSKKRESKITMLMNTI